MIKSQWYLCCGILWFICFWKILGFSKNFRFVCFNLIWKCVASGCAKLHLNDGMYNTIKFLLEYSSLLFLSLPWKMNQFYNNIYNSTFALKVSYRYNKYLFVTLKKLLEKERDRETEKERTLIKSIFSINSTLNFATLHKNTMIRSMLQNCIKKHTQNCSKELKSNCNVSV